MLGEEGGEEQGKGRTGWSEGSKAWGRFEFNLLKHVGFCISIPEWSGCISFAKVSWPGFVCRMTQASLVSQNQGEHSFLYSGLEQGSWSVLTACGRSVPFGWSLLPCLSVHWGFFYSYYQYKYFQCNAAFQLQSSPLIGEFDFLRLVYLYEERNKALIASVLACCGACVRFQSIALPVTVIFD